MKLNNKIIFRSLICKHNSWSAINHSCQSDFACTCSLWYGGSPSSKRRLYTKVKMANFIFGDQARKQNLFKFSYAYSADLGTIFIITPSYTSICRCNPSLDWDYKIFQNLPYVHVGWLLLVTKENDSGAPLLSLAKSIFVIFVVCSQELKYENVLTTELERSLENKRWSNQTDECWSGLLIPLKTSSYTLSIERFKKCCSNRVFLIENFVFYSTYLRVWRKVLESPLLVNFQQFISNQINICH